MKTRVIQDEITKEVCRVFTIEPSNEIEFKEHTLTRDLLPPDFNIGLIIGKSGSGKTTLLKTFGEEKEQFKWDNDKAIVSHFKTYNDAERSLLGAGLCSIPTWLKPYRVLSNGEKHRADLAISLSSNMILDEFVSYVDDKAALGLCNSIQKHIRDCNYTNVIFATLNENIEEYLQPDWIYNTDEEKLTINTKFHNVGIEINDDNLPITNYFMKID